MKSKASFKGHPLHPIIIGFPIAFFVGTLFFDILAFLNDSETLWITAYHLEFAGIITAVIAAVPGIIDYVFTVPPKSSAKKRAAKHGITNVLMLIIFTMAFFYRQKEDIVIPILLGLEIAGVLLLSAAGWMGGTLVHKNQIGVVNRYADSGKWTEAQFHDDEETLEVASSDELKTDQMKLVHVGHKRIVIAKTESGFVAFDDHCTHKGGSLAGGIMICGTVQCPWHGTQFDVTTGHCKTGPATDPIKTYPVEVRDGKVFLLTAKDHSPA